MNLENENNEFLEIKVNQNGKDRVVEVYFYNDIAEPRIYIELVSTLKKLDEADLVHVHIATDGGSMDSALLIHNALSSCPAPCVGFIDGWAASAGSTIMLGCDGWEVTPNARVMCHTWAGGIGGKSNEIKSQAQFDIPWSEKRIEDIYYPFLSKKELKELAKGTDFYFDYEETLDRLQKVIEHRVKLIEEAEDTEGEDES